MVKQHTFKESEFHINKLMVREDDMVKEKTTEPKRKAPSPRKSGMTSVVTLRVTLEGTAPPIWRKLQLSEKMTLSELHCAIQGAFGWYNSHLHMFMLKGKGEYTANRSSWDGDFDDMDAGDSKKVSLGSLVKDRIKKFRYEYDFGDSWIHEVKIEKVELLDEKLLYPRCIDGGLCGPPEDCGGIPGFYDFKEIMANRKHPEYQEMKDWYGKAYDAEKFSVETANKNIRQHLRESSRW